MLLADRDIRQRGASLITPFDPTPGRVQPASYDLTLGRTIAVPQVQFTPVDLDEHDPKQWMNFYTLGPSQSYILAPKEALLAETAERLTLPADIAARVEGKSSIGRLFVSIHVTAGWIDPGFEGTVTLEIVNHGVWPVVLRAGMKIAQVNFMALTRAAEFPYGQAVLDSHYQGQQGATPAAGFRKGEPERKLRFLGEEREA